MIMSSTKLNFFPLILKMLPYHHSHKMDFRMLGYKYGVTISFAPKNNRWKSR
jgi:hypothetical protein